MFACPNSNTDTNDEFQVRKLINVFFGCFKITNDSGK